MGRVERTNSLLKTGYLYAVIAGGFAAMVHLAPETMERADHGLLLFAAMAILSEWAHVPLARGAMSLSFSVVLPAYFLYGTGGAIACQVIGYLLGDALYDSRGWQVKLFNMGQYTLTLVGADVAFRLVHGLVPLSVAGVDLLGLLTFTAVYFVVNHVFVGVWFTLTQPEVGYRVIWRDPAKWEGLTYLITGPLGVAVIMLYSVRGLASVATLFAVSLAAAFVFRLTFRLDSLNRELRLLYEGAQKLGQGLDLEAVKDHTLELLGKLAPFDLAAVLVWDDVSHVLRCVAALPAGSDIEGRTFRPGAGPIGSAAEGLEVKVLQFQSDECEQADLGVGPAPFRSMLVAPMVLENELVGCLVLASAQPNSYSEEHMRLLTIFAAQAGTALNRALHYHHTRQLAITDAKTGVYNYRFFYERLVDEIRRHEARQRSFSIIFLDLDYLKDINDRYGHQVGDDVLIQVASIISGSIRETDEVARYGGEEFVVLLPGTEPDEAMTVAERIRQAVERHTFTSRQGIQPIRVTITAGVSAFPDHATQPDELIFRADEAMYSGKHLGRNRVLLYVPVGGPATSQVGPA